MESSADGLSVGRRVLYLLRGRATSAGSELQALDLHRLLPQDPLDLLPYVSERDGLSCT